MSKTIEEMAREYESGAHKSNAEAMRAALLWLADNVSDEMFAAFFAVESMAGTDVRHNWDRRFAAALRAAGDGR